MIYSCSIKDDEDNITKKATKERHEVKKSRNKEIESSSSGYKRKNFNPDGARFFLLVYFLFCFVLFRFILPLIQVAEAAVRAGRSRSSSPLPLSLTFPWDSKTFPSLLRDIISTACPWSALPGGEQNKTPPQGEVQEAS